MSNIPLPASLSELPPRSDPMVRSLEKARRMTLVFRVANMAYWLAILGVLGYLFMLATDREPPVQGVSRTIVNPEAKVRPGEQIMIRGVLRRMRQCELTRRWVVVDGIGKRHDFDPDRFDAVDQLGANDSIQGPKLPLDANPGGGRVFSINAYDCNPLQRALGWSIVVVTTPLEFEILPR